MRIIHEVELKVLKQQSEQYIPSSWDTDEGLPPEYWDELFGNSADESDFQL